jgi:4-amino-4-deoxy-L-arabinose transferase-like glycosyltransferase
VWRVFCRLHNWLLRYLLFSKARSTGPFSNAFSTIMTNFFETHRGVLLAVVFTVAVFITAPGIGNHTGPTSKDEYHRVFRTALTMMEEDVWLVPFLDGSPRIEKPPLLNWLTRWNFERFGVSLRSARSIVVIFAALLSAVVLAIGLELTNDIRYGVTAAAIALSNIGIAIHGRILLPDVPTAALSALAFLFFLKWSKTGLTKFLPISAIFLAVSFLTKGPVALVVFGSGVLALLITSPATRAFLRAKIPQLALALVLFTSLSLIWYAHVYFQFTDHTIKVMEIEFEARRFGRFHLDPLLQFAALFFPWTVLLVGLIWRYFRGGFTSDNGQTQMLLLWTVLSLMPFLFIRSFDRYLVGTLVPTSLFCASGIDALKSLRSGRRVAVLLSVLFVGLVIACCYWFKIAGYEVILLSLLIIGFAWIWSSAQHFWRLAAISALLWCALIGFAFPTLGVNAMPPALLDKIQGRMVFLFKDPQPAMLPMIAGESLDYVAELSKAVSYCSDRPLVFSLERHIDTLKRQAWAWDLGLQEVYRYKSILAVEKIAKSAYDDFAASELRAALKTRSLEPLKSDIVLYESVCAST